MKLSYKKIVFLVVALLAIVVALWYALTIGNVTQIKAVSTSPADWALEVFDKVQTTYWKKSTENDLANLFGLAIEKVSGDKAGLTLTTKKQFDELLSKLLSVKTNDEKKKLVTEVASVVLYNLPPAGRNALYTLRDETALRNEVKNVDLGKDLYGQLGLAKGASTEEVEKSYKKEEEKLLAEGTPEAKKKIEELSYAKSVLTDTDTKANYDTAQIEPTVFTKLLSPEVYYIHISKFSPTTFDEFVKASDNSDKTKTLKALVLDVRGNIGGAVDIMPYFMGLFLGQNEYAYDFFYQDIYEPNKTKLGKLPSLSKFKHMVLLTDGLTQSSAEIMTATLKRFNKAIVVGKTTRGWGTIENTFPIETTIDPAEKYSLFLVHRITLRDDSQPIEGRGVDPHVDTTKSDWKNTLSDYVTYQPLFEAVKNIATKSPIR